MGISFSILQGISCDCVSGNITHAGRAIFRPAFLSTGPYRIVSEKHVVEDNVLFTNHLAGNRGFQQRLFRIERTQFKLSVTSSNQFLPVVAHDK